MLQMKNMRKTPRKDKDTTLIVLTVMDHNTARLESDFNTFVGSFKLKAIPKVSD